MNTDKLKKFGAGAAIVAILAGTGGSLALWSDTKTLPAFPVQTGNLELNLSALSVFDVSDLQRPTVTDGVLDWAVDDGTATDITSVVATFKYSPEDVVRVVIPITVTTDGTNIAAKLEVAYGSDLEAEYGVGFTVEAIGVSNAATAAAAIVDAAITPATSPVYFLSTANVPTNAGYVVYEIAFDNEWNVVDGVEGEDEVNGQLQTIDDILSDVTVSLTQVRG